MEQNALFYPHIGLHNPSWIKAMALFYDTIYRIVPDNVIPDDSPELQPLLEEGSIGRMIDPAKYSKQASEEFLAKIDDWRAAALCFSDEEEQELSRLHTDKTDERVRELFREAGYKEENNWMYVPTALASNFMLYMANLIGTQNKLSLITSDWGAWTGTSYFGLNGQIDEFIINIGQECDDDFAEAFGLFGLVLSELVPINIAEIPANDILKFRDKRRDEINNFRKCMHDLREELSKLESHEVKIGTIQDKVKELIRVQDQYKSSADIIKAKGWFGVSLMGFPAPMIFGQLFSIPHASTVALGAAGLSIGGLFNIQNTKEELRKLNQQNTASFLVELRKSFKGYTHARGGGDINFHAFNCMEEYVND
ncbi:hypothetical protein F6V30_03730 [Oryzomonas sagensis]|uniref:Uncharacterized protein n=1 Tax=Oryzomonas sagensis TaxID=2603857 RepID=A0ABQ6TSD1_9BACT|nr:DUF6236 family protein [Oryzomonas sagensis]KAB0671699.1 hypothetical protein F6V30_03730 [Oryzomonas sagensis]